MPEASGPTRTPEERRHRVEARNQERILKCVFPGVRPSFDPQLEAERTPATQNNLRWDRPDTLDSPPAVIVAPSPLNSAIHTNNFRSLVPSIPLLYCP